MYALSLEWRFFEPHCPHEDSKSVHIELCNVFSRKFVIEKFRGHVHRSSHSPRSCKATVLCQSKVAKLDTKCDRLEKYILRLQHALVAVTLTPQKKEANKKINNILCAKRSLMTNLEVAMGNPTLVQVRNSTQ